GVVQFLHLTLVDRPLRLQRVPRHAVDRLIAYQHRPLGLLHRLVLVVLGLGHADALDLQRPNARVVADADGHDRDPVGRFYRRRRRFRGREEDRLEYPGEDQAGDDGQRDREDRAGVDRPGASISGTSQGVTPRGISRCASTAANSRSQTLFGNVGLETRFRFVAPTAKQSFADGRSQTEFGNEVKSLFSFGRKRRTAAYWRLRPHPRGPQPGTP